jgi:hypothetical protein
MAFYRILKMPMVNNALVKTTPAASPSALHEPLA